MTLNSLVLLERLICRIYVDYVACKWRYVPFVMLILNKYINNDVNYRVHVISRLKS